MTTIWQQLGAFVVTANNLSDHRIEQFAAAGGRWLVPVVYGDDHSGPDNLQHLPRLIERCEPHGIRVGAWGNGWGGDPFVDAQALAKIARDHALPLVIADLEAAYQWPKGNPNLLPSFAYNLRAELKNTSIGISTNGLNNSGIWNGRTLSPARSMYDLGIRVLPQWYTWMGRADGAKTPFGNMQWLKENGGKDGNFRDPNAPNTAYRGVPLSYVHGTLESTGLEGSVLAEEIGWLRAAKPYGYTVGWSLYTLENAPDEDLALCAAERGKTFLV